MSVEFHSCCERACEVRGKGRLTLHKLRASSCGYVGMEPKNRMEKKKVSESNRAPETRPNAAKTPTHVSEQTPVSYGVTGSTFVLTFTVSE